MMQRGKNRSACFDAEEDDRFSLGRLTELSPQFGCTVYTDALRTHPVHLLLTPERRQGAVDHEAVGIALCSIHQLDRQA
jgi:putative transposase